jgi:ribonuclease HI
VSIATIHIDGGSRGNPGPASFAYVIEQPGQAVVEHAETIGTTTNNVAEYSALVAALAHATELRLAQVQIFSDSELLVKQMNGEYRVKSEELQSLYREAQDLRKQLGTVTISHVRREKNKRADELCNLALDGKPLTGASGSSKVAHSQASPKVVVSDKTVREDILLCLNSAAQAWAKGSASNPPVEAVWEQIWSILEDGNVLKKK